MIRVKSVHVVFSAFALFGLSALPNLNAQGPPAASFTLPDPGLTVNLDAYRESFNRWPRQGGNTRARRAGAQQTQVTIEAHGWAHAYGPRNVPPAGRQILIGRLVNMGTHTTDMYSLQPGSVAEYYLFATNVGGKTGWEMREVGVGSQGKMPIRSSGLYTSCNHPPATRSEADFKTCANASASNGDLRLASSTALTGIIQSWMSTRSTKNIFIDDPAWISCDGGCCTLDAF